MTSEIDGRAVCSVICRHDGIRAREIADILHADRRAVNQILYRSPLMKELCYQDRDYCWHGIMKQARPHIGLQEFAGYYAPAEVFTAQTEEEWLAALRGPRDDSELKRKKIAWEAKYVCKSFVAQYLDGDYELAEHVFCLAGGKELKKLCDTNISKNKEMCDESTGKIAQIIRAAMRR